MHYTVRLPSLDKIQFAEFRLRQTGKDITSPCRNVLTYSTYLTRLMASTDRTAVSIFCESIPTCVWNATVDWRTLTFRRCYNTIVTTAVLSNAYVHSITLVLYDTIA